MDAIEALIAPILMLGLFLALLWTAFRATDGARRSHGDDDS